MTYSFFRTSQKHYYSRPPASSKAARIAWDVLSTEGELVSMRLLDGMWMCKRKDGKMDEVDASYVRGRVEQTERERDARV